MFSAPEGDVSVDDLIDAVERTAGDDSVFVLQHMGGAKFLVCTRNASQATRLMVAEGFEVNSVKVPVEAVGPPVTYVNVYRYPAFLPDEVLSNALAQFGKVKSISFATLPSRQTKLNGVRLVKIEMSRPVPNFLTIAGHRVMCEYRGMRRVCARCGESGHMATACTTAYCKRCSTFGHETEGCSAECKRCGGQHGTAECFRRRSYASAARGFPSLPDRATAPSQLRSPASPRAVGSSSRLQVLSPKSSSRTTTKGPLSEERDTSSDQVTDSGGTTTLTATVEETRMKASTAPASSSDTESSDFETVSTPSSPLASPAHPLGEVVCQSLPVAPEASPDAPVLDAASSPDPKAPANALAPVTSEDLKPQAQDPARDEVPIVSRGFYMLPGDRDGDRTTLLPPSVPSALRPNTTADQSAPGREQRTRSRSRRRKDDVEAARHRTPSKEPRQRRPGPEGRSSDSDAPPHAKAKKLDTNSAGKGEPPPKPAGPQH